MKHRVKISEAISTNRYINVIRSATYKSVEDAFFLMAELRETMSPVASKDFASNEASHTRFQQIANAYFSENFKQAMHVNLTKAINEALGADILTYIVFREIPKSYGGYASGTSITLSDEISKDFSKEIMDSVFQIIYDNYDGEDRVAGFHEVCAEFSNRTDKSRWWWHVESKINPLLHKFTRTVIHELVHVLQHAKQHNVGRHNTDYRSYLDKKPGELVKTYKSHWQKSHANEPIDPDLEQKYYKLYYASPQEMAAFAHEAAYEIIKSYGFDDVTTPEELQIKNIQAADIINNINWITGKFTKDPRTRREAMVRNRYIKLVYQEIVQYLNYRLEQLKY
jgi:hypothetical protein